MVRIPLRVLRLVGLTFLPATLQAQTLQVTRYVNLRSDPSTEHPSLGLLRPPLRLTLVQPDPEDGYYFIRTPVGEEGWVWAKNVRLLTADEAAAGVAPMAASSGFDPNWDRRAASPVTPLTSPRGRRTIENVERRLKTLAGIAALIGVGAAVCDVSDLGRAAAAMACCAKTDYQCAGVRTPDDCCQTVRHAPAHPVPATATGNNVVRNVMVATLPSTSPVFPLPLSTPRRSTDSKHPHDPPHLHAFNLLI